VQIYVCLLSEISARSRKIAEQRQFTIRRNIAHLVAIVAEALIAHRPEWVIRASINQADGLIARTQSKYYFYAAEWL
jgi:uncharacterized Zn finger protein